MSIQETIVKIENLAERANPIEVEDYIDADGLMICHKCHTRKQARVKFFFGERVVPCLCKCKTEERERKEEEIKHREFIRQTYELCRAGFPEADMKKLRSWNFKNDDGRNEDVSAAAKNYVLNFDEMKNKGKGYLFFGETGTGKTYISACILNALIDQGHPCLITSFSRIVNNIQRKDVDKQKYIDSLCNFELVVIDDLATERNTEFVNEMIYNVIDVLCKAGTPIIITTNLTRDELTKTIDITKKRIYSRLFEMCFPIEVKGKDRRREILANDYEKYKDVLGLKRP